MHQNNKCKSGAGSSGTVIKRLLIIVLTTCLLLSASVFAFAADTQATKKTTTEKPFDLRAMQSAHAIITKELDSKSVYNTSLIRLNNQLVRLNRDIAAGKRIENENAVKIALQNSDKAVKAINLKDTKIQVYDKKGAPAAKTAKEKEATQKRLNTVKSNIGKAMKHYSITSSSDLSVNVNQETYYNDETDENRSQNTTTNNNTSSTNRVDTSNYTREVFRLVNKERVKAGLNEVEWDDDFARCAQIRAVEANSKFSHERPGNPDDYGRDWPSNVSGGGIYNAPTVADEQGVDYVWVMENLGKGYQTPEAVVRGWMNSSGHRANILRESHTRCGVGFYNYTWALWLDE